MKKKNIDSPSISENFIINLIIRVFSLIAPIITTPYISRVLGPEAIGVFNYCYSIEIYFAILGQFGIPIYAQREIAKVRNNQTKLNEKYSELLKLQIYTVIIGIVVYGILIKNFKACYYKMFLVCGVEMIANLFNVSWLFIGLEDFKSIAKRDVVFRIITVALIFAVVKKETDIYIYAICLTGSNLICSLILFFKGCKKIKFINIKLKKLIFHLKPSGILMLPGMINIIYSVIDETMIGGITNDMAQVGVYEQAQKIVKISVGMLTTLGIVLMPRLTILFDTKQSSMLKKYITKGVSLIYFLSIPMGVGCFVISKNMVPWFFGKGFNDVIILLKIFAPMYLFMGISDLIGVQLLISMNEEKKLLVINIITVILNLSLNIIFIHQFKALGAAIATVISEFVRFIVVYTINSKYIDKKIIKENNVKYMIASMIMFFILIESNKIIFAKTTFISTISLIIIGLFSYLIACYYLKESWSSRIVNKIFKRDDSL